MSPALATSSAPFARAPRALGRRHLADVIGDLVPAADLLALLLAVWLASRFTPAAAVAVLLAPFVLYERQFGKLALGGRPAGLVRSHLLRFSMYSSVVGVLALVAAAPTAKASAAVLAWLAASFVITTATRLLAYGALRSLAARGHLSEAVAVVGRGPVAERLVQTLRTSNAQRVELLGVFDDAGGPRHAGTVAALIALAATRRIDWIVLTQDPGDATALEAIVSRLQGLGVPIALCPQHIGLALVHRPSVALGPRLAVDLLADRPIGRGAAILKATEDCVLGTAITLLLLPLLALIALAIRLDSPGPVLFRQRRHALDNREFDIFKFRTMRWEAGPDTEAFRQTTRGDRRITRVGRFLRATSLDELPQLFNVLGGTMSLVGPRPHAVDMRTEDRLGTEITALYPHRHRVKPGMTGWAQVNGARGATVTAGQLQRRVELDLHYIDHWSLLLDLRILARTAGVVLRRTDAF